MHGSISSCPNSIIRNRGSRLVVRMLLVLQSKPKFEYKAGFVYNKKNENVIKVALI